MTSSFNKVIFGYWHQGRNNAPDAITRCWNLWTRMNPGWEVRILEWADVEARMSELGIHAANMSLNGIANIVRIDRLAEEGGVWVDAYTVPLRPLDNWLPALMPSGFFAFHDPHRKRLSANWFLASIKAHSLSVAWRDEMIRYWRTPRRPMRFSHELDRSWKGKLTRLGGQMLDVVHQPISARGAKRIYPINNPVWAVSPNGGARFGIYPYFAMAMLFDRLIEDSETLRRDFADYPKITPYDSLMLRHWRKRYNKMTEQDVRSLCHEKVMQKLNLQHPLPDMPFNLLLDIAERNVPLCEKRSRETVEL